MNNSKLWHRTLFEGVASLAAKRTDLKVELWPRDNLLQPGFLRAHPCSGIITQVNAANRGLLLQSKIPVINVATHTPSETFPAVTTDQIWVGECAANYFLRRGHAHFGYIGYSPHHASKLRLEGYARVLATAGKSLRTFEFSPADREDLSLSSPKEQQRLKRWLLQAPKPLALFCFCDAVAHVALRLCLGANLAVPAEVSVLGADDDPMVSRLLPVTLSSINPQLTKVGQEAGKILLEWIKTRRRPPPATILPTARLVTRRSTDHFAVGDELVADVLDFMQEHVGEPLSIPAIARHTNCSRRKLERRFRARLQMSVHDALQGIRIERASQQIAATDLPLKEIAAHVGFRDARHMSVVFRKKFSRTPTSFRSTPPHD